MTREELLSIIRTPLPGYGQIVSDVWAQNFADHILAIRAGMVPDIVMIEAQVVCLRWPRRRIMDFYRRYAHIELIRCIHCDTLVPPRAVRRTDEYAYCEPCFRRLSLCACGQLCMPDDSDHRNCNHLNTGIHSYGTQVTDLCPPRWLSSEKVGPHSLLLGVELEVEPARNAPGDIAKKAMQEFPEQFVINKSDSSLSDNGFEIVSAPATLAFHRQAWDQFMTSEPRKQLLSFNTTTCGMHVHLSKTAIAPLTLGKMLLWFNQEANALFLSKIAGRNLKRTRYARLIANRKPGDLIRYKRSNRWEWDMDRYEALNLATGKPTVEVRIFKGTLNRESFLKNLDFCAASVAFCEAMNPRELTSARFIEWMQTQRKAYPFLYDWLQAKGYLAMRDVPEQYRMMTMLTRLGIPESDESTVDDVIQRDMAAEQPTASAGIPVMTWPLNQPAHVGPLIRHIMETY